MGGMQLADGAVSSTLARLPSIVIGPLQQSNANYYVLPTNDVVGQSEFDGLLGGKFFKQYDADFDFGAGRLNIFLHCAGQVVYWPAPAVAVVPFRLGSNNNIRFWVELDGKSVNAMLDTGASTTFLNPSRARRTFGVDVNAPGVEKIGDISGASMYRRRFKTLAFEGVTINDPLIVLTPDLTSDAATRDSPPDLILGMTTLSQMHVYIAYKERKLYITAATPQPAPQ